MNSEDKSLRSKKQRLAELKLMKERLEAELAAEEAQEEDRAESAKSKSNKLAKKTVRKRRQASGVASTATREPTTKARAASGRVPAEAAVARQSSPTSAPPRNRPRPDDDVSTDDPAAHGEDETDEEEPQREPGNLLRKLRGSPPWLVSMVIHGILFVFLALATIVTMREDEKVFSIASSLNEEMDTLEEISDVALEQLEVAEPEEVSIETKMPDPGQIQFGDVMTSAEAMPVSDVGQMAMATDIGDIGALFGKDGKGMSELGDGIYASVSFFGTKSQGRRFVFVVDNSNSMGGGRYETALDEMMKSVSVLGPKQQFYVIFFSDMAYRMFHPKPSDRAVAATPEAKERLRIWLYDTEMCLRTNGLEAVQAALALRPDVVYILGDGAFGDKTGPYLTAPHNRKVVINTLGMEVNDRGRKELAAIAKANGGTYKDVATSPAMKKYARENPIKKNRVRGKVWGLKLPVAK